MITAAQPHITNSGGASTLVFTINNVTAGNLLTLTLGWSNAGVGSAGPPSAPTDTNGTWSAAINPAGVPNGGGRFTGQAIYYLQNANAGTHVITWSAVGSAGFSQYGTLSEWNGVLTSGALDAPCSNSANSTTNVLTLSVTTAAAVSSSISLILTGIGIDSNDPTPATGGLTGPPAWTQTFYQGDFNFDLGVSHDYLQLNPSSGSYTATFNWTDTTASWLQGAIAVFKGVQPTAIGSIAWTTV